MFEFIERGAVTCLVFRPWLDRGIEHGFTVRPVDFSADAGDRWRRPFLEGVNAESLRTMRQVHGTGIVAAEVGAGALAGDPEGDAFILEGVPAARVAWGVKTADCAPILVVAGGCRALIHAGWRGLARGIISTVLERLPHDEAVECVIGPCAGPDGYEVGQEVVAAIGDGAQVTSSSGGAMFLDVAATAQSLIGAARPDALVWRTTCNSVFDHRFHSFRRDGGTAGRSLGFFVS